MVDVSRDFVGAKISVFVICAKAIVYLLLYNLHDFTLKSAVTFFLIMNWVLAKNNYNPLLKMVEKFGKPWVLLIYI